jgi:MFS family permease
MPETVPAAPHAVGTRDLLRLPDFRRLYVAQAVSDVGDGMTYLALFLVVLALTGSTAAIALMSILVALPPVTIGLFAGAWADRADRRRIMVGSDALRAVVVLLLVPAVLAGSVPAIFVLATVQAVIGTFFAPARIALVPRTVPAEGLMAANSLGQLTKMIAGVVGATVTGVIAGSAGVVWPVFIVDAASFLVSALVVIGVARELGRPAAQAAAAIRARGMGASVAEGLRVIARSAPLLAALGGVAVTMLGVGAINVLFIPFLVDELGASPAWAGPLEAAQTLAMVLSGALLTGLATRVSAPRLFTGGLVGVAACIALLSIASGPLALLAILFAVGLCVMPVQATTMTIVQRSTTDETRGRVGGALNAAVQTATIASMAAAGILATVVGMRGVFAIGAAVTLAAAILAWALFRRARVGAPDASGDRSGSTASSQPQIPDPA